MAVLLAVVAAHPVLVWMSWNRRWPGYRLPGPLLVPCFELAADADSGVSGVEIATLTLTHSLCRQWMLSTPPSQFEVAQAGDSAVELPPASEFEWARACWVRRMC